MLELEDKSLIVVDKVYLIEFDWTLSKWYIVFDNGSAKYITEKDKETIVNKFNKYESN